MRIASDPQAVRVALIDEARELGHLVRDERPRTTLGLQTLAEMFSQTVASTR